MASHLYIHLFYPLVGWFAKLLLKTAQANLTNTVCVHNINCMSNIRVTLDMRLYRLL